MGKDEIQSEVENFYFLSSEEILVLKKVLSQNPGSVVDLKFKYKLARCLQEKNLLQEVAFGGFLLVESKREELNRFINLEAFL
jgi:hypothetical protein